MYKKYICRKCGGENISREALLTWHVLEQRWVIDEVYNEFICYSKCKDERLVEEVEIKI